MHIYRLIHIVLHPLLLPTYMIFFLFHSGSWLDALNPDARLYIYLVTATTTGVLPFASLLILKRVGWISDYRLQDSKERRIPLMIWSLFALTGAFVFIKASAPLIIALVFNSISIVLLICAMLTYFWKVSIYLVYLGAFAGIILTVSFKWMLDTRYWLALVFLLSGLLGFSRLRTQSHKPADIYGGFGLGVVSFFLITYLI